MNTDAGELTDTDRTTIRAILSGPDYFYCQRGHARIKKEECIRRQKGTRRRLGDGRTWQDVPPECVGCSQGKEISRGFTQIGADKKPKIRENLRRSAAKEEEVMEGICEDCGEKKEIIAKGKCRVCYDKQWRKDHPDKVREYWKKNDANRAKKEDKPAPGGEEVPREVVLNFEDYPEVLEEDIY